MPREKRLVYDVEVYPEAGANMVFLDVMFRKTAADGLVWMQFTGLNDKNGKEIYEGDIVRAQDGMWAIEIPNLEDGVILNDDRKEETSVAFVDSDYSLRECKVIGNIHENPELLK